MKDNLCCCVCLKEEPFDNNPIINCDGRNCNTTVHKNCYGIQQIPDGAWFCQKCISQERSARVRCELCPSRDGALKHTNKGGWCHIICALFMPGVEFIDSERLETISIDKIANDKMNKICSICEKNNRLDRASVGACVQCIKNGCKVLFHVTCAQSMGLLTQHVTSKEGVRYIAYCSLHKHKTKHRDFTIRLSNSLQSPGKYEKQKLRQTPPQLEKSDEDCGTPHDLSSETERGVDDKSANISSSSGNLNFSSTSNSFEEPSAPEITSSYQVPPKLMEAAASCNSQEKAQLELEELDKSTSGTDIETSTMAAVLSEATSVATSMKNTSSHSKIGFVNSTISSSLSSSSNNVISSNSEGGVSSKNFNKMQQPIITSLPSSESLPDKIKSSTGSTSLVITDRPQQHYSKPIKRHLEAPTEVGIKKEKVIKKEKKQEVVKNEGQKPERVRKPRKSSGKCGSDKKIDSRLSELLNTQKSNRIVPNRPKSVYSYVRNIIGSPESRPGVLSAGGMSNNSGALDISNASGSVLFTAEESSSEHHKSKGGCVSHIDNGIGLTSTTGAAGVGGGCGTAGGSCQSMEELLEWQWDQAGSVLMQQAADATNDIASLLSCLHDLKNENEQLVSKQLKLSQRRDHLKAVNAKLELQLVVKQPNASTNTIGPSTSSLSVVTTGVPPGTSSSNSINSNTGISNSSVSNTTTTMTTGGGGGGSTLNNQSSSYLSGSGYNTSNQQPKRSTNSIHQSVNSKQSHNVIKHQQHMVGGGISNNNLISHSPPIHNLLTSTNGSTLIQADNFGNYQNSSQFIHLQQPPPPQQQQQHPQQAFFPKSSIQNTTDLVTFLQSQLVASVNQQQQQHQQSTQDLVSLIPPPPSSNTLPPGPPVTVQSMSSTSSAAHNANMEVLYQAIQRKQQYKHQPQPQQIIAPAGTTPLLTQSPITHTTHHQHPHHHLIQSAVPSQQLCSQNAPSTSSSSSSHFGALLHNSVQIPQVKIPTFSGTILDNSGLNHQAADKAIIRLAHNIRMAKKSRPNKTSTNQSCRKL